MSSKDEFQQQLKTQIAEWQENVRALEKTVSAADANVHPEMQERIRELRRRIDTGKTKLGELGDAANDDWQTLKDEIESAVFAADDPEAAPS